MYYFLLRLIFSDLRLFPIDFFVLSNGIFWSTIWLPHQNSGSAKVWLSYLCTNLFIVFETCSSLFVKLDSNSICFSRIYYFITNIRLVYFLQYMFVSSIFNQYGWYNSFLMNNLNETILFCFCLKWKMNVIVTK